MLKRKIETYLAEWKEAKDRKPLVIKGIRQCGKTYIVQKFAKEHYENVVYMNFILEPDKKSAFTGNIDVDTIILNSISVFTIIFHFTHKIIFIFI